MSDTIVREEHNVEVDKINKTLTIGFDLITEHGQGKFKCLLGKTIKRTTIVLYHNDLITSDEIRLIRESGIVRKELREILASNNFIYHAHTKGLERIVDKKIREQVNHYSESFGFTQVSETRYVLNRVKLLSEFKNLLENDHLETSQIEAILDLT